MNGHSLAHRSRRRNKLSRPTLARALAPCAIVLPILVTGCADPAADAPDAVVTEPSADAPVVSQPVAATSTYIIDREASKVGFVGSKVTGSHSGGFQSFEGTISVAGTDPTTGSVNVTIDATSVWSDDDRLTGHLQSEDFFSVEEFPTATFSSTAIASGESGYEITGELELHGVKKQIRFPATITVADEAVSAQAEFSIKRFDFGIEYPGRADDLIRDEVLVQLDLQATRPSDA